MNDSDGFGWIRIDHENGDIPRRFLRNMHVGFTACSSPHGTVGTPIKRPGVPGVLAKWDKMNTMTSHVTCRDTKAPGLSREISDVRRANNDLLLVRESFLAGQNASHAAMISYDVLYCGKPKTAAYLYLFLYLSWTLKESALAIGYVCGVVISLHLGT